MTKGNMVFFICCLTDSIETLNMDLNKNISNVLRNTMRLMHFLVNCEAMKKGVIFAIRYNHNIIEPNK